MKYSFRVFLHPIAELEYLDSVAWYEEALPGLGEEFMEEVSAAMRHVAVHPRSFPRKKGSLREVVLKKFHLY